MKVMENLDEDQILEERRKIMVVKKKTTTITEVSVRIDDSKISVLLDKEIETEAIERLLRVAENSDLNSCSHIEL